MTDDTADRRTGQERRRDWRETTERLHHELLEELDQLEQEMRQLSAPSSYWAERVADLVRRHREL